MIKAVVIPHTFHFNFPGGTSRGVLTEKPSFIIKIWDESSPEIIGLGEVSLIPGLSPENSDEVEKLLSEFVKHPEYFVKNANLTNCPAVRFGIETAFLDLKNGGKQMLFPSEFTKGTKGIRINGLVWMGEKNEMLKRLKEKVAQGFTCIKIKVGAIDFDEELSLLKYIRSKYSHHELEIRVDANGAFTKENAMQKLNALAEFGIHSIEQPIKQGQWQEMTELCKTSPIAIALDEELIGINEPNNRIELLETIKPQYIILKPSLIGGLEEATRWSTLAIDRHIGWWVTSALEGNIGLNAIAQWTYVHGSNMPQGLGTGQVFTNNIESPLEIRGEKLWYNPNLQWELDAVGIKKSTPVLRTPPQEGEGTLKPLDYKKHSENESLHNSKQGQFKAVPLEGVPERRGWNKTLATKENNYHYNTKLKDRAIYLRKHATKAEACLWKYALNKRPMGFQFTRQRPVLNYIADFMCTELMLIIEVDGATHFMDDIPNNDEKRQRDLEAIGFTVFRFEDEGVLKNISGIQTVLEQFMNEFLIRKNSTPVLRTPPQGGDKLIILPTQTKNETLHSSTQSQFNAVPLEGVPERRGWNKTSESNTCISDPQNLLKTKTINSDSDINSTPVLRTGSQGGEGTLKPRNNIIQTENETLHSSTQSQFNAVPLEGDVRRGGRGWNKTSESNTCISDPQNLLKTKTINSDSDINSTPVLRTPPQGGDKLMITPKQTETHAFESPENISTGVCSGARGWNITLNNITYDLQNADWNILIDLNKNASWWEAIVSFLKEWANNLPTVTLTTSGSTGKPKQLEVGKAQMWLSASKTCDFFQLTENSTGLLCLSANYIAGKMMLVRAMVSGMNLICIEPSGNPVKDLKIPIDFAAMVPMQVEQSLLQVTNLNQIKNLIVGGGQVSNSLALKLNPYTGKAFETFGMTETLSHIALKQLTPEYQNYFTPFNGVFVLQGFNNEMVIDFSELGIYKLKTNDIIEIIDTSGRFVWKGRTDFIINSGGIKISPEETESKIAHLIPQRFCICGMPDSKLGETVILIIEGKPYQTDALKQKIREVLPAYSCPKIIQFLSVFPLTETGKIKRKELVTLLQ